MKKSFYHIVCSLALLTLAIGAAGQTTSENYITVFKALKPLTVDLSTVNDKKQVQVQTTYFDGLGRPIQSVAKSASPQGFDLVTVSTYDPYGRQSKTYLPYATQVADGNLKSGALSAQSQFYNSLHQDANAFAQQLYEKSDLARPLKQGAPGAAWQPKTDVNDYSNDHSIKTKYLTNTASEVLKFSYNKTAHTISAKDQTGLIYYPAGTLSVTKVYDEANHVTIEYKDKEGRVILKRVQAGSSETPINDTNYASTYYIYDEFGNLAMVLSPEGSKNAY